MKTICGEIKMSKTTNCEHFEKTSILNYIDLLQVKTIINKICAYKNPRFKA
jgi:hypothetical protein